MEVNPNKDTFYVESHSLEVLGLATLNLRMIPLSHIPRFSSKFLLWRHSSYKMLPVVSSSLKRWHVILWIHLIIPKLMHILSVQSYACWDAYHFSGASMEILMEMMACQCYETSNPPKSFVGMVPYPNQNCLTFWISGSLTLCRPLDSEAVKKFTLSFSIHLPDIANCIVILLVALYLVYSFQVNGVAII